MRLISSSKHDMHCVELYLTQQSRKYLAGNVHCWKKTFRLGYQEKTRLPTNHPIRNQPTSAGSSSARTITQEMILEHRNHSLGGPGVKEIDLGRTRYWALASGHTFYTYPHYDASGMGTWSIVTAGIKVWSYLRCNISNPRGTVDTSKAIVDIANALGPTVYEKTPTLVPTMATPHNIFLTAGTLL